ncbi:unnamed protein product [Ectocarpus sp. CCAP 1310/34]|nr:unnamed protein product [Ectocarpus sp. CCAP 1310/34]
MLKLHVFPPTPTSGGAALASFPLPLAEYPHTGFVVPCMFLLAAGRLLLSECKPGLRS